MFDEFLDVSEVLASGVYALLSRGTVVYIGKSKCMLARVYAHRNRYANRRRGKDVPWWLEASIPAIAFDQIMVLPCSLDRLDRLEKEMIERYRPKYNERLKPSGAPPVLVVSGMAIPLAPSAPRLVATRR